MHDRMALERFPDPNSEVMGFLVDRWLVSLRESGEYVDPRADR